MNGLPRIVILGTGGIAKAHLRGWQAAGAEIRGLIDVDPARVVAFKGEHGLPEGIPALAGIPDARSAGADLLVIATPPHLHAPQVHEALDAGLHVVVEKPVAPSLQELDRLIAHARAVDRLVLPTFQNRWGLGPARVRALQAAGLTGAFRHGTIETCWRRLTDYWAHPWRSAYATAVGGAWACLAIHAIDTCLALLPAASGVSAHLGRGVHAIEVDEGGCATVTCADGAWLALTASVHAHEQFTRGMLVFEHCQIAFGPVVYGWATQAWPVVCTDPARQAEVDAILAGVTVEEPPPGSCDTLWWGHTRACIEAWRSGDGETRDLRSARPVTELLGALYHSGHCGGVPVPLPLPDGHAATGPFGPR